MGEFREAAREILGGRERKRIGAWGETRRDRKRMRDRDRMTTTLRGRENAGKRDGENE